MSDLFLSYSRHDRDYAQSLATELTNAGYDVWWDFELHAGDVFTDEVQRKLDLARLVLVIWSEKSTASNFVRAEARIGLEEDKLVPIRIDDAKVPIPFNEIHTPDFSATTKREEQIQELLGAVANRIGPGSNVTEPTKANDQNTERTIANSEAQSNSTIGKSIAEGDKSSTSDDTDVIPARGTARAYWDRKFKFRIKAATVIASTLGLVGAAWLLWANTPRPEPIELTNETPQLESCRLPGHGVEKLVFEREHVVASGWGKGGRSLEKFCVDHTNSLVGRNPGKSIELKRKYTTHKVERTPFKHDYYNLHCHYSISKKIFKLKQSAACQ